MFRLALFIGLCAFGYTLSAQSLGLKPDTTHLLSVMSGSGVVAEPTNSIDTSFRYILTTPTVKGALSLDTFGRWTYLTSQNFSGMDSFYVQVCGKQTGICESVWKYIRVVDIDQFFLVPNSFSPNGDNINECFVISNIDLIPKNQLVIFDRLGQVVYSREKYDGTWCGQDQSSVLNLYNSPNTEMYYYTFQFTFLGSSFSKKGYIYVVR